MGWGSGGGRRIRRSKAELEEGMFKWDDDGVEESMRMKRKKNERRRMKELGLKLGVEDTEGGRIYWKVSV